MIDVRELCDTLPAFLGLPPAQLDELAGRMTIQAEPAGHVFGQAGEPGHALYLLLEGAVRQFRPSEAGGESRQLGQGEIFNLLGLVADLPLPTQTESSSQVTVARLERTAYEQLKQVAPELALRFKRMLAVQLARELQYRNQILRHQHVKA